MFHLRPVYFGRPRLQPSTKGHRSARPALADPTPAEPLRTSGTEVSRSQPFCGVRGVTGFFFFLATPSNSPYRSFQKGKVFCPFYLPVRRV